jgi:predicted nucleotidyltransferase component of viral defense system
LTKQVQNMAASVRSKLQNISRQQGKPFEELLMMYMLERLLYRLSKSYYKDNFILKGGLYLCVLFSDPHRTTKDVDFLARKTASQIDEIRKIFIDICSVEVNDGITCDIESIRTERIKEDAQYEGVRVLFECYLGQAKKTMQIDIGFGDVVVPKPIIMSYPVILEAENPEVYAYSIESVIAEKFEAMIKLAQLNSRMKDFYDIYTLSERFDFDGRTLYEAVYETFQRRGTPYEKDAVVFDKSFSVLNDKQKQWAAFLKRTAKIQIDFITVVERIRIFLFPIYEALLNEKEFFGKWFNGDKNWH